MGHPPFTGDHPKARETRDTRREIFLDKVSVMVARRDPPLVICGHLEVSAEAVYKRLRGCGQDTLARYFVQEANRCKRARRKT